MKTINNILKGLCALWLLFIGVLAALAVIDGEKVSNLRMEGPEVAITILSGVVMAVQAITANVKVLIRSRKKS